MESQTQPTVSAALLAHAYGDQWSTTTERALLEASTSPKPAKSLEDWLRDRFFQEHCKLFHNRPFIWHIWDGRKDGFHALVNYHRLAGPEGEGRRTLESLTFAYLNEWIERQGTDQREGIPGADGRLATALDLQDSSFSASVPVNPLATSSSGGGRYRSRPSAGSRTSTMECA